LLDRSWKKPSKPSQVKGRPGAVETKIGTIRHNRTIGVALRLREKIPVTRIVVHVLARVVAPRIFCILRRVFDCLPSVVERAGWKRSAAMKQRASDLRKAVLAVAAPFFG
jgi:hypothetical protein